MSITSLFTSAFRRGSKSDLSPETALPSLTSSDVAPDVRRLIRQRQYCKILTRGAGLQFEDLSVSLARQALEKEMAVVPPGPVSIAGLTQEDAVQAAQVAALYIDRTCVTNADYLQFVTAGGYQDTSFWPDSILTELLQFRDSTGEPGPRFWMAGKPPKNREDHPVVGISWYEANAYAQWTGKRLPTPAQWQRAGSWGKSVGANEARYPWGNAFHHANANTWSSRVGDTVPVHEFSSGATPSGVHQMIGNTWEWLNGQFSIPNAASTPDEPAMLLAEIRGGAFDTYFASQATCQFRSGQPLLVRAANIGFRCCIECSLLIETQNNSGEPTSDSGAK